jgi:uncharacterized protein YigA (DUF484 family)
MTLTIYFRERTHCLSLREAGLMIQKENNAKLQKKLATLVNIAKIYSARKN